MPGKKKGLIKEEIIREEYKNKNQEELQVVADDLYNLFLVAHKVQEQNLPQLKVLSYLAEELICYFNTPNHKLYLLLTILGDYYHFTNIDYNKALKYYKQALTIKEKVNRNSIEEHIEYTTLLNNIGLILHYLARYKEAIEYYKRLCSEGYGYGC